MSSKIYKNRSNLSTEWESVLNYYVSLSTKKEKDDYIKTFTGDQQKYFLTLLQQSVDNDTEKELTKGIKDIHLLDHKKYEQLKNRTRNQKKLVISAFLVIILLMGIGLFQTTLFAQIASYVPALKGGVITDPAVLSVKDSGKYEDWVNNYLGKEHQADYQDPDNDGLSNKTEFLLQSNPSISDENKDGVIDGMNLLQSIDPINSSKLNSGDLQKLKSTFSFEEITIRLTILSINKNQENGSEIKKNQDLELLSKTLPAQLVFPSLNLNESILWQQNDFSISKNLLDANFIHVKNTSQLDDLQTTFLFTTNSNILSENINNLAGQEKITINTETETKQKIVLTYQVISINILNTNESVIKSSESVNEIALLIPTSTGETKMQIIRAKLVKIEKVVEDIKNDLLPKKFTE